MPFAASCLTSHYFRRDRDSFRTAVVEDTPLLSQSPEERPPTWQSACRRCGELLRRILFSLLLVFFLWRKTIMARVERQEWSIQTSFSEALATGRTWLPARCVILLFFTSAGGG
jgi:hypothetical protein